MWPTLLNLTRDDCRRTLRRLELEAYSNIIDVFRAQGALEDNRKKILEELRAVLHISSDRHSAEARRVANDELLATIAEQSVTSILLVSLVHSLAGPNTGLGWISEGRRRVPLMPRGVPQTAYTEIADKSSEITAAENKELISKLEAESLAAPKSNEDEMLEAEGETAESALSTNEDMHEILFPPVAMEDPAIKIWETELMSRKRKVPEGGVIPDETTTPVKNIKNITPNTNQKHLNLSQLYSKFTQTPTSKPLSQSKHSYNQVSKVSTSKSNQGPKMPRSEQPKKERKPRQRKNAAKATAKVPKSQRKKSTTDAGALGCPKKQYNPVTMQLEYAGPPNSFQASYAQSLLGKRSKSEFGDDMKPKMLTTPGMVSDSPTMQLLTQPAAVPHELAVSDVGAAIDDPSLQAQQTTPTKHTISGKPCQLIIKKRGDMSTDKKVQMSDVKILQKPTEGLRLLSSRPVVVAPSSKAKSLTTPTKIVTTKLLGPIVKSQAHAPMMSDKMIVVSKSCADLSGSRLVIGSSTVSTPSSVMSSSSVSPRVAETVTPKGIPTTDIKVSAAKTFLINPKSGKKMVVVPAKARPKTDGQSIPLLHFKSMSTGMRLVPVSPQSPVTPIKSTPVTVVSRSSMTPLTANAKVVSVEPIKTANMADIVPVKNLTPVATPKTAKAVLRPGSAKSNVIVVQKGTPIGKALSFAKNGSDMSKIIMGKNVNKLLQAKHDQKDGSKGTGNVIVLELNNDQTARTTTMSEILDSRAANPALGDSDKMEAHQKITEDTPVLFDNQITEETCNASSLDSTAGSIGELVPMDTSIPIMEKEKSKATRKGQGGRDSSSVTDWEIELETVSRKGKGDDDKLNSLHLDLGMSSDSDSDFIGDRHKAKSKHSPQGSIPGTTPGVESRETFESSSALSHATRTLLSQLQDEGSSSNDSSFALKSKADKLKVIESKTDVALDKSESEALNKAKEKLTEKVAKAALKRIDVYSTAISTSEINLDSFSYLEEGMMAGDEDPRRAGPSLDDQLSRLLGEDSAASNDSQPVSDSSPSNKQ